METQAINEYLSQLILGIVALISTVSGFFIWHFKHIFTCVGVPLESPVTINSAGFTDTCRRLKPNTGASGFFKLLFQ